MNGLPAGCIAVVGLACRFPGADSPEAFWELLSSGGEAITRFSQAELDAAGIDRATSGQAGYVGAKGVVDQVDGLDAAFFGFSPFEAALMDPQQRIFLECAWMAFEDAGYEPKTCPGSIGVFAGSILSSYLLRNLWPNAKLVEDSGIFQVALGNDPTFLATRTSYLLDLKGPSISVGTACSTSLAAVHLACQSLLSHESDMALAGGSSVHLPLVAGYRYEEGGILSPDGHCRPFDAEARGTVSSDGAGAVLLKRLEDAVADGDTIHAVIRGSAINNDGRDKVGFTAPSISPQVRVIEEALAIADVAPETVTMIEAHAAGTLLGDPIEVAALVEVFGNGPRTAPCAIGSVKSNIGHVDAAAGVAGLIKTVLALRHRTIPPSLHYRTPNPKLDFGDVFTVPTETMPHDPAAGPMRAGVSSFGIGGTNVHVVLEQPPPQSASPAEAPAELLMLSARSAPALDAASRRLAEHLRRHPDDALSHIAHTLRVGRRDFDHRRVLVVGSTAEALEALDDPESLRSTIAPLERKTVAFMFPGLGDHYPGMGWELYCSQPLFRAPIDDCAELLRRHEDGDIRDILYPGRDWSRPVLDIAPETPFAEGAKLDLRAMLRRGADATPSSSPLDQPTAGQPAIFVTEYALAQLLRGWGIEPDAMIGYSIGEFVAACLADIFPLPEAIRLVAARARLIQTRVAQGVMLAVPLGEAEMRAMLPEGVSIAAVNTTKLTIVSGAADPIAELERRLVAESISSQRLNSGYAYHSAMMDAIVGDLAAIVAESNPQPPRIPYVSCLTGDWISDAEATDPEYWARHLCRTVRFQDGLEKLMDSPDRVLLELGPGQSLGAHALATRERLKRANTVIPTMRWSYGRQSEPVMLLRAIGHLWQAGVPIAKAKLLKRDGLRRIPLPTYPFERVRHWIDPPAAGDRHVDTGTAGRRPIESWFELPYWKPAPPRDAGDATAATWLLFVDDHGVGSLLAERLHLAGSQVITVAPGDSFEVNGDSFRLDPRVEEDYHALARALRDGGAMPDTIVHLWSLAPVKATLLSSTGFSEAQIRGFHSLMRLLGGLTNHAHVDRLRIEIVSNGLFDVTGHEALAPEKITLLGPAMVAPQERPGITCRCIDTDIPPDDADRRAALVDQMLGEFAAGLDAPFTAYRNGRRWMQDYEPVRLDAPAAGRSPLRHKGTYLLTGGLGGVGLAMAQYLARSFQARLVLVGRSSFPARGEWSSWLSDHGADDRTSLQIRRLEELEALGAEILTVSADVADRVAMERVLEQTEARFGALHGVFHGAGAVGVETFREIAQATTEDAETQFRAKAHGLLVLDQVLAGRPLDFCVLMSSLSAILGGLGFAAYGSANLFLDAFARAKARTGGVPWVAIDWDSWRLTDLRPAIDGLGGTIAEFFMEPDEAAAACEMILTLPRTPQVIVSTGDLRGRLRQWMTPAQGGAGTALTLHERPKIRTDYAAPRGQLEQTLAEIWRDLFTIDPIGVHDNFFELGGHSLLATQLTARISSRLQVEISLAAVLQAPTVAELAQVISDAQLARADPETLARMLAEVGDLTAEELESLLAEDNENG